MGLGFTDQNGDFSLGKTFGTVALGVAGVAVVGAGFGSFYTVDQSEVAMVKRFGELQAGEAQKPGLHTKLPFVDDVVTFSIAPRQTKFENLDTNTGDNQPIKGTIMVTFKVPVASVPRLISDVGWESRIESPVVNGYKEVMGRQDAVTIAANRAKINDQLTTTIKAALSDKVGLEVTAVELVNYDLDPEFMKVINEVAKSKGVGEKLKQDQQNKTTEMATAKIAAEGEAAAAFAKAEGAAKATRAKAEADAYATKLQGAADAEAMTTKIKAVGDPKILVDLAQAEAWKSGGAKMPETLVTGGNSSTLLMPAAKAAAAAAATPKP